MFYLNLVSLCLAHLFHSLLVKIGIQNNLLIKVNYVRERKSKHLKREKYFDNVNTH